MTIKSKVTWGVVALFAVILTTAGVALFFIRSFSDNSKNVLKANYESIEYTKRIIETCDSLEIDPAAAILSIEKNLVLQESNITEPGERALTAQLRLVFEALKRDGIKSKGVTTLRLTSLAIQELNMQAIVRKNQQAQESAAQAQKAVMIIAGTILILAFTFIVNFPGYIANPIAQLTSSIKSIANKDYEERLHFDRKDEFGELAEAFNQMAEKLDEYEHSNLANLLFEKKRIETIINKMADPIIGLDEKKKIIFVNTEALKVLSIAESELVGEYAPDVAVRNDLLRNLLMDLMNERPLDEKSVRPLKIFLEGKENYFTKDILKVSTVPTGEKSAVLIGYVVILKNITPFKELDLAKTNFIATISHELKTPLASIQMCAQLLDDTRVGELNPEQKEILKTITEEINRLKRITSELLNLAQVETGNIRLEVKSVRPHEIIDYALSAMKFQAEQKQLEIEVQCPDDLPNVKADLEKTTWVLINLLSNAIHYSAKQSRVVVNARREDSRIVFSVRDFGAGINTQHKDKVFDKFYRIPGSDNTGTGLGLAIAKDFISSEGGRIWVESEPGQGSTFAFELGVG